jgi:hypothetical protein
LEFGIWNSWHEFQVHMPRSAIQIERDNCVDRIDRVSRQPDDDAEVVLREFGGAAGRQKPRAADSPAERTRERARIGASASST